MTTLLKWACPDCGATAGTECDEQCPSALATAPERCPVCEGESIVPNGRSAKDGSNDFDDCAACGGAGWRAAA